MLEIKFKQLLKQLPSYFLKGLPSFILEKKFINFSFCKSLSPRN